jgi:pimeloyl-ACP methyl ester carboxylesterase
VLAAARNQTTTFAMSVSAPLTTPEQQMQFATKNLMNVRGYSPADVNEMLETRKAWTGYLKGANSRDAALNALAKVESRPWFKFAFMPKASQLTTDPTRNSYRKEMDYDPVAPIRQLKIPLLFIFGGADPWVPVATSAPQLRTLAKEQPNIQYAVIPDANHEMMFVEHDTMEFDEKAVQTNGPQAPEISCCWPHGFASNWASEIRKTRFSLARKSASQNSIRVL